MPWLNGKPLLVIIGPTAVGKTNLSLLVGETWASEIVSADSRLFYRQMDIGTAKPTQNERNCVPHHLIDIANPNETVTLGWYQREAYRIIDDIQQRERLPILVGGTGQYMQAVCEGWGIPEVPPHWALREELEKSSAETLHERLQTVDPIAAQAIHPNNKRRVIRALEVCLVTNRPISELQRKQPPPYDQLVLGLYCERETLYGRIDARVDQMIKDGLLAEVEQLLHSGYDCGLPAMSGLGYQQLCEYIAGKLEWDEAVERIKFETHRFVRHQNNWFERQMSNVVWVGVDSADYPNNALAIIDEWLNEKKDDTNFSN